MQFFGNPPLKYYFNTEYFIFLCLQSNLINNSILISYCIVILVIKYKNNENLMTILFYIFLYKIT